MPTMKAMPLVFFSREIEDMMIMMAHQKSKIDALKKSKSYTCDFHYSWEEILLPL